MHRHSIQHPLTISCFVREGNPDERAVELGK